jgi:phage portal protein BeeE
MHFAIGGNAFFCISRDSQGNPLEIWSMHPAITKIVTTVQGEILSYVMRAPGSDPVVFKPEEVKHFALPNPTNSIYGEGRVELLIEEAGIDLMALRSNKAIFQDGLSP